MRAFQGAGSVVDEASFAALCGLSPVERSSGRRQFASNATRPGRSSTLVGQVQSAARS
ncbi:transposase [Streptomyces griseofuscus]|uniref:transposase n=1 Tax=Streptomyces griseofuscus TaxID=146922 RepID=UPI000F653D29